VLAAAIAGGVLWSNALAYHEVWLAPRPRLAELQTIGHRFAGTGPTLMTDFELYGLRHFLRSMDPEGVSTTGRRPMLLTNGQIPGKGEHMDVDNLRLENLLVYRTLVLRRSPVASRPPSAFDLVSSGRYYEVWQRRPDAPQILSHLSLGSTHQPGAKPDCATVTRLASLASRNKGRLATVERPTAVVQELAQPGGALSYGEDPAVLYLRQRQTVDASIQVPASGDYGVWVGGSFRSRLEVTVDGREAGADRQQLNWPGNFAFLGAVTLDAGVHNVSVRYAGPDVFHPGSAGEPPFGTGPLVLAQGTADRPVQYVEPQDARTLCGKNLDWVEAVA
jgi:hypothetical protein